MSPGKLKRASVTRVLLNYIINGSVEIAVNKHLALVFPGGPILGQGQVSMDHIFKWLGGIVDLFNFLVFTTLGINDPPGKLHLRSRLCLFQSCYAMNFRITRSKLLRL